MSLSTELLRDESLSVWSAESLAALEGTQKKDVFAMIDEMGNESFKAQGLSAVLTTAEKLSASDHLYMLCDEEGASGIIKVAFKHLFYVVRHCYLEPAAGTSSELLLHILQDRTGAYLEVDPLCVMDFYVSSRCQRRGVGIRLFKIMLEMEQVADPSKLAFDRPSSNMLPFLAKHFNLVDFVEQPNRFVIFNDFFA